MIKLKNKNKSIIVKRILFMMIGVLFVIVHLKIAFKDKKIEETPKKISFVNTEAENLKAKKNLNKIIDNYLREYSIYYNLDENKVIEFARNITDNYNLSFDEILGGKIKSDRLEGQVLLFVHYLSRDNLIISLKQYGLSVDYFKISNNRVTMGNDQILRNGLTFSQFLGKVCDNLGVDKNYSLAISYLETGKNTSWLALNKNNFGGLRGSGGYFAYSSPEDGIISFVLNLKGYEKYNLNNIYELSGIYTHGNRSNPSNTWVNNVQRYYNKIIANSSEYFYIK